LRSMAIAQRHCFDPRTAVPTNRGRRREKGFRKSESEKRGITRKRKERNGATIVILGAANAEPCRCVAWSSFRTMPNLGIAELAVQRKHKKRIRKAASAPASEHGSSRGCAAEGPCRMAHGLKFILAEALSPE
jgi:hypothetical protein